MTLNFCGKKMKKIILALSLAAAFAVGSAHAIFIDDFTDGAQSVTSFNGSNTVSTIASSSALGGFRTISINSFGPLGAKATVVTNNGGHFYHSADTLTAATSTITWDANGTGLGGVDFIEGLINNVFLVELETIDQGNIDLTFSIADTHGGLDSFTFSDAIVGINSIAFSNFSGVDFTVVDSLSFQVAGGAASDLSLKLLGTAGEAIPVNIPEPTSLALLGSGLLVFGFGCRKTGFLK